MERIRNQQSNKANDVGQINHRFEEASRKKCDGEEGTEDAEGALLPESNAFELCAICHLIVGAKNADCDRNVPCSKGHALCQRCLQHFAIRAGPGCVLCRIQSKPSSTIVSRESNDSLNSIYVGSKKRHDSPQSQLPHYKDWQQTPLDLKLRTESWAQNCSMPPTDDRIEDFDRNGSERDCYYGKPQEQNDTWTEGIRCSNKERSYCSIVKRERQNFQCVSELKINGQVNAECSRRPIRCPRVDCAINVAFSALTHHFVFDHPEVPILNVDPETKSTLIVSFAALSPNSSRCLALLLVSGKLSIIKDFSAVKSSIFKTSVKDGKVDFQEFRENIPINVELMPICMRSEPAAKLFNGSQINPRYRNRLPLPVLAARLSCTSPCTPANKVCNNVEEYYEKDIIIAWVAGLDPGNRTEKLRCSIQAVDNIDKESVRSLTYTGPVNSLRSAQKPEDVFLSGDCIVLHDGLLSHIASDSINLNINVIVH